MKAPITFYDSSWYCYANCTAMLLSAIGEQVSPRLVEVLSAVGLGASIIRDLPFFGELTPPDRGISQALDLLGFTFTEAAAGTPDEAHLDYLPAVLREGPAVLGPLDMVHLSYNPLRPPAPGADHYVVAYASDGERIHLHDPAGFAHVFIERTQLARAWRAESIGYRRGYYRYWTAPRRATMPSSDEVYDRAIATFRELYRDAERRAAADKRLIGRGALLALAEVVRAGSLSDAQRGHLTRFAVPLAAKRALDYASFFAGRQATLHTLKLEQARAFGSCLTHLVAASWAAAAAEIAGLAQIEAAIKDAMLRA